MIRVLLVDDQALMRSGFRMILEAQPDIRVVGEAGDGLEALRVAEDTDPDVVVMDVRMPRCDGVEATRRMPGRRVLVLTTFDLDEYVVEALRAGASGFLLKDASPEQLVDAVRVVASGDALLAPQVTRRLLERVVPQLRADAVPPPRFSELTDRELEVLRLVARGHSNLEVGDLAPRQRSDGEDPRLSRAPQAGAARPRPGGGARLRARAGGSRFGRLSRARSASQATPRSAPTSSATSAVSSSPRARLRRWPVASTPTSSRV